MAFGSLFPIPNIVNTDQVCKPCKRCLAIKPLEEFSISRGCKDGRHNTCKECFNKERTRVYWENKKVESVQEQLKPDEKRCTGCKLVKPLNAFYFNQFADSHIPRCKVCAREDAKKYRKTHAEKMAAIQGATFVCGSCQKTLDSSDRVPGHNQCNECKREYVRAYRATMKVTRPDETVPEKICPKCKEVRPAEEFNKNKSIKGGLATYCRSCAKAVSDSHRIGMEMEEFVELKDRQLGLCAICREPSEKLFVDHDHSDDMVRGLLCPRCNTGLGFFLDHIGILEMAIEYLKSPKTEYVYRLYKNRKAAKYERKRAETIRANENLSNFLPATHVAA